MVAISSTSNHCLVDSVYVDFVRDLPFVPPRKALLLLILNSLEKIRLRTAPMRLVPSPVWVEKIR